MSSVRTPAYPVNKVFVERWSPRAFASDTIPDEDLMTILEAARWAPSSYNSQPWRFMYAKRHMRHWSEFLDVLVPFNRAWAGQAAALVFVASTMNVRDLKTSVEVDLYSHSFDAGTAAGFLMLQASLSRWHTHAMTGFDIENARTTLMLPNSVRLEAAIAIGRIGDASSLPDHLAAREAPSGRLPADSIVCEGPYRWQADSDM